MATAVDDEQIVFYGLPKQGDAVAVLQRARNVETLEQGSTLWCNRAEVGQFFE